MRFLSILLACWLSALALPAAAATYTPSASAATATAYPWIDISASGTGLNLGDDATSATLNIGFNVDIGNTTHTGLRIMSNGQVQFGGTSNAHANLPLPLDGNSGKPNIDAVLLPLWDNLNPGANQIRWASQGTAPNRVFVASWISVPFFSGGGTATFQVQIHEKGQIVYRYQAVTGGGGSALIGLEVDNTDYVQYSRNTASVVANTTIVWTRTPPAAAVSYLFNEQSWNGTTGEVRDSAGLGQHGTAAGLAGRASTSAAVPAIAGGQGTCGYGVFDRSDKQYVLLPATLPDASGTTFTVTAWFRSSNPDLPGQRVIADDENLQGWLLSLGDGGTGRLRFFGRSAGLTLDTANIIAANTWYFVVLSVDATAKQVGLQVYSTTGATLSSLSGTYTSAGIGADAGRATIGGNTNAAVERTTAFGFSGFIDDLRVFNRRLVVADHHAVRELVSTCPAYLLARYDFSETAYTGVAGQLLDNAGYGGGPFNGTAQGSTMPGAANTSPARAGSPGTCSYATFNGPRVGGASFTITGLPATTSSGAQTTLAFWMYWDGTDSVIPISFDGYGLLLQTGWFGFNTTSGDVYGIASTSLANGWRHVVAVFTNGSVTSNQLWIDGVQQTLAQRIGSPNLGMAVASSTLQVGAYGASTGLRFSGRLDQVRVYNGAVTPAQVATLRAETPSTCVPPLHHLEIQHANGTGLTCTPSTVTVKACADAACSTLYTSGVSGTLSATGGSVNWPATAAFSIPANSSTTTVSLQATTTTATVLGVASSTPAASNAATCNFGSPACTFTAADAGFLFNVPDHVSETAQTVSVSAVRKSDNSTACTPAFASTSKSVAFSCGYTNPTTGTLPVRVGGVALNSGGSSTSACDSGGNAVSLAFNASGVASTTVQYADAGQMLLSARFAGAAGSSEAGLVMTGSDSFIAAPDHFTIDAPTAGPIRAGSSFSATVTARNALGNTTPNHGRETSAQRAAIGWVMRQPTGTGAVPGSFSGTGLRSFTNGAVTASDLVWTEVGRGDLVVRGSDASGYLGSGLHVFGSSLANGARSCAVENANCVLPGGTAATVYYGAPGGWTAKGGQTGTVACTNGNFGDPIPGTVKRCYYAASAASNGSVGDFIPHRFSVAASHACGSFSYAGQPIATTVRAQNAAGNTTVNFNGTATTTPKFAQAVTLADADNLGLGTLSGESIDASAFSAGVATATPSYAFTSKATAPQSLVLRATNGASGTSLVSSQGYTEPTLPLRSGRLRLSNAFGKATAALQLAAVTEYWAGNAWLLNSADSCTALAGASVALGNPRDAAGATSNATSTAGALAISGGSGSIGLAAPSPAGSSLSLDVAVNLGSGNADQSCHANHPATIGAGKPWLRAQNGSCATTADRDPAARASFGIFSPETRKTVHVREIF